MLFAKKLVIATLLSACMLLSGCGDNPGTWPREKLEEYVKTALKDQGMAMTEVTLVPKEGGGFEGTGQVEGGETLTLVVTQNEAEKSITWDAKGDRGSFLDGSYEIVQ